MNLNIYQISLLVSKQKVNSLGLFNDAKSNKQSKYFTFFHLIHDGKVKNDIEAANHLGYKNKATFLKFKERFTKKILDYLLLQNARNKPDDISNNQYAELMQLFSIAKILRFRSLVNDAIEIYTHINNKASKYEYLDLLLLTTIELKKYFAFIEPNKKQFKFYTDRLNKCKSDLDKIHQINHHYDEISHNNIVLQSSKLKEFKKGTIELSNNLLNNIADDDTYEYKNKVYEIAAFSYNLNEKYQKSIELSKASIKLSKSHFKMMHTKILIAHRDILSAYLRLNDIKNAHLHLSIIIDHIKSINHNYLRFKSLEFTLYVNTYEYEKLYHLTKQILSLKKLKEFKIHREEWTIREAFLNILIEAGKIDSKITQNSKRKFRLSRFINDVEFYSKDKRGTNISVLVIQLIHFLLRKEYSKIVDRLDALNQYTFRYLRNDETLRSNCFIKMLLKLPEAEYHPIRTKRYVARYEKKLAENPFQISLKEIAVEIIPYEELWKIIMEILNLNLEQKKRRK